MIETPRAFPVMVFPTIVLLPLFKSTRIPDPEQEVIVLSKIVFRDARENRMPSDRYPEMQFPWIVFPFEQMINPAPR